MNPHADNLNPDNEATMNEQPEPNDAGSQNGGGVVEHALDITSDDVRRLAEALAANTSVRSFSIGGNRIDAVGAQYLAEALKVNKNVTYLNLNWNVIGSEGARYIADALLVNTSLKIVDLRMNAIDDKGVAALLEAMQSNKTLHSLLLEEYEPMSPLREQIDLICHENRIRELYVLERGASVEKFRDDVLRNMPPNHCFRTRWLPSTYRRASLTTALSSVRRTLLVTLPHNIVDAYLLATLSARVWFLEHILLKEIDMEECWRLHEEREKEMDTALENRWVLKWRDFVRIVQWCLSQCDDTVGKSGEMTKRRFGVKCEVEKEDFLNAMMK